MLPSSGANLCPGTTQQSPDPRLVFMFPSENVRIHPVLFFRVTYFVKHRAYEMLGRIRSDLMVLGARQGDRQACETSGETIEGPGRRQPPFQPLGRAVCKLQGGLAMNALRQMGFRVTQATAEFSPVMID